MNDMGEKWMSFLQQLPLTKIFLVIHTHARTVLSYFLILLGGHIILFSAYVIMPSGCYLIIRGA